MLSLSKKIVFIIFAALIFVSFSIHAVAHERILKQKFGEEQFTYSTAFVAFLSISYTVISKALMFTYDHPKNQTAQKYFILVSIFYFIGTLTSVHALSYISYHVQVIGKSCKPISVMIFALIIAKKTYTIQKYFFVLMMMIGVTLFTFKHSDEIENHKIVIYGYILIVISLVSEGIMSAIQEYIRKEMKPNALNFMHYTNLWTALFTLIIVAVNGEGIEFITFCIRHDTILIYLAICAITGTVGQYFIYCMITDFGSLPVSLVSTLRKFFTVLLSVFVNNHKMSHQEWGATGIIFSALFLDAIFGRKKSNVENNREENCDSEIGSEDNGEKLIREIIIENEEKILI